MIIIIVLVVLILMQIIPGEKKVDKNTAEIMNISTKAAIRIARRKFK